MLKKITDRVYYMDYEEKGDRPVIGLVIGDDYCLVIDAGNSKDHAEKFLSEVEKMNIPPLKYLAITHSHWDHIFGAKTMNLINIVNDITNENLKEMSSYSWTDEAISDRVKAGKEIKFSEENLKIELPNNNREVEIINADIIYDEFLKINLGGIIVELERIPTDHSKDCSIIHIPSEKVVFLGDSTYLNMHNGEWSYSKEFLIPLLKELQYYEADYYVPSHHELYNNKEFNKFSESLISISKQVKNSIDLDEAELKCKSKLNRDLTELEKEYVLYFVRGNRKKEIN